MIAVDAKLLVYAHATSFDQHEAARSWLEGQLETAPRVGVPWSSPLAFARLTTNPSVFSEPSVASAERQVEAWLGADAAWIPFPRASISRSSAAARWVERVVQPAAVATGVTGPQAPRRPVP